MRVSAINLTPVSDLDHQNQKLMILNLTNNAVVPNAILP